MAIYSGSEQQAEKQRKSVYLANKRILDNIQKNAAQHRFEFVRDLDPAKAEPFVGPLAVFSTLWGISLGSFDGYKFESCVDLETLVTGGLMHNPYGSNPGFLLLAQIVSCDLRNGYHFANKVDMKVKFKGSDILARPADLDDLYSILLALGYEMTDEEKQWRDGTHPAYM